MGILHYKNKSPGEEKNRQPAQVLGFIGVGPGLQLIIYPFVVRQVPRSDRTPEIHVVPLADSDWGFSFR